MELCRELTLGTVTAASAAIHLGYLLVALSVGIALARRSFTRRLYLDR